MSSSPSLASSPASSPAPSPASSREPTPPSPARSTGGSDEPIIRARGSVLERNLAVVATAGMVLLELASSLLTPKLPADKSQALAVLQREHLRSVLAVSAFVVAQLASIGATVGIVHLLRRRSPRLAVVGGVVSVLGAFGHSVYGGINLMMIFAAADAANRSAYAGLLARVNQQPFIGSYALIGLVGVVIGPLLLSIGIFRTQLGPRIIAPLIWAFLLIEFVGSSVVDQLGYVSPFVAAVAYALLIRELLRRW